MSVLLITETNFPVGLFLGQSRDFDYLMRLVETHPLTMAIPEFCLREARSSLRERLRKGREGLIESRRLPRDIGRSEYARERVEAATDLLVELEELLQERIEAISETIGMMENICSVIPHSPEAHVRGRLRHISGLPPFKETDCEIFECILDFLRVNHNEYDASIFLCLDQADFDYDEIRDDLAETDTRLSFSTGECIAIVRRELGM
jgi:hypothetical protein